VRGIGIFFALLASPVLAEGEQKSEVGTAYLERCLADVTAHRIATLKRQVPEYAASLSDEELTAGGMKKARHAGSKSYVSDGVSGLAWNR